MASASCNCSDQNFPVDSREAHLHLKYATKIVVSHAQSLGLLLCVDLREPRNRDTCSADADLGCWGFVLQLYADSIALHGLFHPV